MGSTGDPAVHRPVTAAHQWQAINDCPGAWRCLTCGLVANTGMADPPAAGECHGKHLALSKVGDGHRLVCYKPHPRAAQQLTCFACELCHRTSTAQPVFEQPCPQASTRSRAGGYRRLERGLHPHPRWGNQLMFQQGHYPSAAPPPAANRGSTRVEE